MIFLTEKQKIYIYIHINYFTTATCPMLYQTSAMFSSEAKLSALSKQLSVMSYCWAKKQQSPRLVNSSALYTPIWRRRLEEKDDEKATIIVDIKLYLSRKDYGMLECHVWRKHLKSSTFCTEFFWAQYSCCSVIIMLLRKHWNIVWCLGEGSRLNG